VKTLLALLVLFGFGFGAVQGIQGDIECPGCEPSGPSLTVLDKNGQFIPGWCCGIILRWDPAQPSVPIPGLCICKEVNEVLICDQKEKKTGCSYLVNLQIRCAGGAQTPTAGSVRIQGGPVLPNTPCVGNWGPTFSVAMEATECGKKGTVAFMDCYSDAAGTQFLCTIALQISCKPCGKCELTADD
jgi:hypothetical protein